MMNDRTQWLADIGWGIFIHYLVNEKSQDKAATTSRKWNSMINSFNVEGLADQLESVNAGYLFITVGQTSGHYCAPNPVYDSIVGINPSKCSERDLVMDLHTALDRKGIKLMAYVPSDGSSMDPAARERLEWECNWTDDWGSEIKGLRLAGYQRKWESILREWSLRWGKKISGWWVDGCYFADAMYRHEDEPNFRSFAGALKAGNPDAITAFNPGVFTPLRCHTEFDDYTAGEISKALPECHGPWVKFGNHNARYHVLTYLGEKWCGTTPRFPDELVTGYTKHIIAKGGAITWDVPTDINGLIPAPFLNQLKTLSSSIR